MLSKFSDINNQKEWHWKNLYQRETNQYTDRLLVGCANKEIPTILNLCKEMKGPFGILYVLLVSKLGNESGRYQSPNPINYEELELFLYEHQEFFEQDGRHNLWISSISGESQFIFDKHNFIYCYGEISIPFPHTHNYHFEFDDEEEAVIDHWNWVLCPLEDDDDL